MKLVAIDNGYWATKVYARGVRFSFRSKYEKASDTLNNNILRLTYEDNEYLVGDGASIANIEYDKTTNELHKICTYTALARLSSICTEFNLVVGYPLSIYVNGANKFAEYLQGNDYIEVRLNGELRMFKINKCTVFPQCAGAMYVNPDRFRDKIVGILDFGGLTVNGCIFENLNLIRESIFTENMGCIILFNKIKKALESKYGISIQEYEMPFIVKNGLTKYTDESLRIINEVILAHLEEIRRITRLNKWNIDNIILFATGGTTLLFSDLLQRIFPNIEISSDPIFDNVKGFYRIGEMLYEKNI